MPEKRVLFFAEAVTLAHAARPFVLAKALRHEDFKATLAWHPRYSHLFSTDGLSLREIHSISSQQFVAALAKGSPLYDLKTLRGYVEEDLAVIDEVNPDLIVGDFRLSLGVSTALAGIPYVAISNAYWSPYAKLKYIVPELPVTRLGGAGVGQRLFDLVRPLAFALHARPMHRLRKAFGLAPLVRQDLRYVYTQADYTLYSDLPDTFVMDPLPANHRFLGPITWSPQVPLPSWWATIPGDRPVIYVTLGSSGAGRRLDPVLAAVSNMDVAAIVATAGSTPGRAYGSNVFVENFLPGGLAAAIADLVLCNGGSPTTQQALVAGKPVLGIPGNMDQFLNMDGMQRLGVGLLLRPERLEPAAISAGIHDLLANPRYRTAAEAFAERAQGINAESRFQEIVDEILPTG